MKGAEHTKISNYKNYDDLPPFLNAALVEKVLGVPISNGYKLMHKTDFPILRVGNRMKAPKKQFMKWVA